MNEPDKSRELRTTSMEDTRKSATPPDALTPASLLVAAQILAQREPVFRGIMEQYGPPPLWERPPGFATLVQIILEQQVSLASARAAFEKLKLGCPGMLPGHFLELDDRELKEIGFSRQKTAYCRGLAAEIAAGRLDLDDLSAMGDDEVRAILTGLKGIGPWTAEIYLLMALRRPDAWPVHDLALIVALKQAFGLSASPTVGEFLQRGESWRPYRAVAARLLWHFYLRH